MRRGKAIRKSRYTNANRSRWLDGLGGRALHPRGTPAGKQYKNMIRVAKKKAALKMIPTRVINRREKELALLDELKDLLED